MRKPRIHQENTVYYVSVRAGGNELLFREEADYEFFLKVMKERQEKYNFKLYAWCLLPQHYHFLLEPQVKNATVSKIMQAINTSYSLYFNKKYNRTGHLTSGRFRAKVFDNKDAGLLDKAIHLQLNPLSLGITQRLEDYKWNSYREYAQIENLDLSNQEFILSFVEGEDEETRRKSYKEILERKAQGLKERNMAPEPEPKAQEELEIEERPVLLKRMGYGLVLAGILAGLVILPKVYREPLREYTPTKSALNTEASVSLPGGLGFYSTIKTKIKKQVWEVWKLGPIAQGETDVMGQQ
ncbi:MAG: hypothetical protein DRP74_08690 [Candidatus Omnitrophota bacterium]|nr:MAG: hypothetical protein DRP74_08690 [Candidatus Omnitrophota bacterium]